MILKLQGWGGDAPPNFFPLLLSTLVLSYFKLLGPLVLCHLCHRCFSANKLVKSG